MSALAAGDDVQTLGIPVEQLRVGRNIPAGMDICVIASLVMLLRKTAEDPPPIQVYDDDDGWRVRDGRHRFFAAVIAGRPDVLAFDENWRTS